MTWLNRFLRRRPPQDFKDPLSERLRTPDPDPANSETRWRLLYEKLKRLFEGWGFDDAHDLANEVIMMVYRQTTQIGEPETFFKALGIAKGVAANARRRQLLESKREHRGGLKVEPAQRAEQLRSLLHREREDLTRKCSKDALDKLPPAERQLFLEYHDCLDSGLSSKACAELLGMNHQTLKNKASIIKFKLDAYVRRCLEKLGY